MIFCPFTVLILERAVKPAVPGKLFKIRFILQNKKPIQFFFTDQAIVGLDKWGKEHYQEEKE
jgi:hypothetical protein